MKLDYTSITRQDFMHYFRDDEMLNQLTTDDRIEIFQQVLPGSSYISQELLGNLLRDYSVNGLQVLEL
ncbi:hypothetical protein QEH52_17395 [Coraliomargarita sp. SDUM461003]|uniref:Uncharacterized protein n=2 Tax=Thalassobacterium maritimum TaxID=3041265 RepID=A0ABU1AYT5_9BACT|nr:hypothetical protein [Coraliomargarita sp. SDUM461003]